MSRRTTAPRRARIVAVAAVTAAGAALLSACAPATTTLNYSPSDGVQVPVGVAHEDFSKLRGLNLMVVTSEEGAPGNLLGGLTNDTREDATFTLSAEGTAPVTVDVPAGETVYFSGEAGEPILLDTVAAAPGNALPTTLEAGGEVTEFQLPVVDGTLSHYADYVPDPAAASSPSASPTGSATPAN